VDIVKCRIQNIEDPEVTIKLAKIIENAGAKALTIHGRIDEAV